MPRMPSRPRTKPKPVDKTLMERARCIEATGALAVATDLSKVHQLLNDHLLDNPTSSKVKEAHDLVEGLLINHAIEAE